MVKVGDYVMWADEHGKHRPALVTAVHGVDGTPVVNLVVINDDLNQTDTYGRKVQRETSVVHRVSQSAHGRYWFAE